ncbi:uncharacterized protein LOC114353939 [Ostrinia furnacalis]|uniref:uncharacterized protein LOC114353939 n=1 Tax=Ostrinia furnacalis TaxID=93504 RepID=UPI00103A7F06|nr:uncharacterized protein LOC114353939 [Ostrinia furnacalis]
MYAHDKLSDLVAQQCFNEMFPKAKHVEIQESDEPCIIFCVLKKLGIMSANGVINLEIYRKRVQLAHQLDQRNLVSDFGSSCVESADATQHKQDVCRKAKVFNDCTHLYRILLKKHKPDYGGTMMGLNILTVILPCMLTVQVHGTSGTLVDFTDPKVQGHLDALVRLAQSCVIKVRASPKDVRAYFTNSSPVSRSGQCFAACMLEQSDIINHGKVNRDLLVHQASLVNGKNSRVVRKLNSISRLCLDSIEGMSDRCQLASTYNDCLNENMLEFAFPLDIAEEAVRKMPFHLIQPK